MERTRIVSVANINSVINALSVETLLITIAFLNKFQVRTVIHGLYVTYYIKKACMLLQCKIVYDVQ